MKITLKATFHTEPPVEDGNNAPSLNRTLGIQIGTICCALRCPDDELYQMLGGLYGAFLTDEPADISFDLARTSALHIESPDEESPFVILENQPGRFAAQMEIELSESNRGFALMNRLFYIAYYGACMEKYDSPPAMFLHACGILRHGRAFVFTGPSESGKTTIAALCGENDGRVINDEMLLLTRPGPGGSSMGVQSAPIISDFLPGLNVTAPLGCILLLKKGGQTQVKPVDPAEAYLRLMRQIIAPIYPGRRNLRPALSMAADLAQAAIESAPVYELEFTINGSSLWQTIEKLDRLAESRVFE